MDDLQQFKATYIAECRELLGEMEERLMSLDADNADAEVLNTIFRCAHSIKGGAGAFGFDAITRFTHVAEFLLDAMREGKVEPTQEIVDALLKSADIITQMVNCADAGEAPPAGLGDELARELQDYAEGAGALMTGGASAGKKQQAAASGEILLYTITFTPHPNLFASGNEPLLILRELASLGKTQVTVHTDKVPVLEDINPEECHLSWVISLESDKPEPTVREVFEFVEDECDLEISTVAGISAGAPRGGETTAAKPVKPAAQQQAAQESAQKGSGGSTIRVDIDKVDRLVNLVGELVITQSMLQAQAFHLSMDQHPALLNGIDELSQHSRELQEAVMSMRMQPVKSIFSRMPRIVRDLSQKLGKTVRLEMKGENTEVDKTVIEQLSDPLTHMIRNSLDHGIEKPDIRKAAGKPEEGVVKLSAYHQGNNIIITISDDGAGINRERVLKIAREKGVVAPDAQLSVSEIENLIFAPGFSTAEVVTDVSGRGVGMDVVRRNIESLGGVVSIKSTPGQGSEFTVSLPLTLAILDGMIVRVGAENYIIPIANIIETLRPQEEHIHKIADGNDLINVRGEFVSILYLHRVFSIGDAITDARKALVVLVENGTEKVGLVVDELLGQQQVVIKSLETNSDSVDGISGATILGDGKVSLILDIAKLSQLTAPVKTAPRPEKQLLAA